MFKFAPLLFHRSVVQLQQKRKTRQLSLEKLCARENSTDQEKSSVHFVRSPISRKSSKAANLLTSISSLPILFEFLDCICNSSSFFVCFLSATLFTLPTFAYLFKPQSHSTTLHRSISQTPATFLGLYTRTCITYSTYNNHPPPLTVQRLHKTGDNNRALKCVNGN